MRWLGSVHTESSDIANDETLLKRKYVATALLLCNRYSFWPTECYTLSLTGKLLLKGLGIDSTLYIGFLKTPDGIYKGHAWLRANDTYISGYREAQGFTIHTIFS